MQETMTVLHEIMRISRADPDRPALTELSGDRTVSYGELARAARTYARTAPFVSHRALVLPPGIALMTALLGTWWNGGTAVVLNPRAPQTERAAILGRLPDVDEVEDVDVRGLLAESEAAVGEPAARGEVTAVILGTSGTSGVPKLVPLRHDNLLASFRQTHRRVPFRAGERVLTALPAFHVAGLNLTLLQPLAAGAHVLVQDRFDPERFLHAAQTRGATRTNLVPRMADMLIEAAPGDADLSTMTVSCGGSALYAPTADAFQDRFGTPLRPGYGLTETCSLTHHVSRDDAPGEGGVGRPLPETEHRIVDEHGDDVAAGEIGEVLLRGPQITAGYLGAEAFPGGWLRTGDLGRVDEHDRLAIVGRRSELIDYNAHLISPGELESHLLKHPAVLDAAVIGRRDPAHGEIPVGVVVLDREVPLEELFDAVRVHVSPHKRLRGIAVVDEIPRTPSGKPLRRELQERELRIVAP